MFPSRFQLLMTSMVDASNSDRNLHFWVLERYGLNVQLDFIRDWALQTRKPKTSGST